MSSFENVFLDDHRLIHHRPFNGIRARIKCYMLHESEPQPGRENIQSKFDPASQIRMQEKNVGVRERAECCREEESGGGGRPKACGNPGY